MVQEPTVRLTCGQAVIKYLAAQWSDFDGERRRVIPATFGIFGHGNVCGLGQALDELSDVMPYFQPKNEQSMVHTAIGYAKATNRMATLACSASIGPGATNMLTGAATATVNRVPVLLLPADTFASRLQGPPMQALDHPHVGDLSVNDAFRPVSRYFDRISRPEQILASLPAAMRVLLDPAETGAVTISIHQDVQGEEFEFPTHFFEKHVWQVHRRPAAPRSLEEAAKLLRAAKRPLIIAGGGVHFSAAGQTLREFADRHAIPVAETSAGKGSARGAKLQTGAMGHSGTRASNQLAGEADVVLAIGTRLIDLTTGSNTLFQDPDVRFVGINVSGSDANKLGALPVVADAKLALEGISALLGSWQAPTAWRDVAVDAVGAWESALGQDLAPRAGEGMSQGQALRVLNGQATQGDVVVVASGTPHVDVHKLWTCAEGSRVMLEVGYSCMGHEIPAALGVRLGSPEGEVYAVIGDGTYWMNNGELLTAFQEQLDITVVVFENHGYQSIHALQRSKLGRSFGLEFRHRAGERDTLSGEAVASDIAANARSMGCAAFVAGDQEALSVALRSAREHHGPSVVVVSVEPHRLLLSSECWWDVGVAQVSEFSETRDAYRAHAEGRARMRYYSQGQS